MNEIYQHSRRRRLAFAGLVGALTATLIGLNGCDGQAYLEQGAYSCPDANVFKNNVSQYLERRCGTLDCHGAPARPLRIYGVYGLRLNANDFPGGADTTPAERDANYAAVCALEPGKMTNLVNNGQGETADDSLLIGKALNQIAHKGGPVVRSGTFAHNCIFNWLQGGNQESVEPDCTAAVDDLDLY